MSLVIFVAYQIKTKTSRLQIFFVINLGCCDVIFMNILLNLKCYIKQCPLISGACPGFLKGGSNISWFPKKRSSDFKRGGPMV